MAYHIDIETLRRLARSVMPGCTVYGLPGGDLHLVMGGNPIAYIHRGALSDDMVVSNNRGFEHALKPETAAELIRAALLIGNQEANRRFEALMAEEAAEEGEITEDNPAYNGAPGEDEDDVPL